MHVDPNHFDRWTSLEGRHLILAYAVVFLLQGGYLTSIALQWRRLSGQKKTSLPL